MRLLIFPQPLGRALKNQNAAPTTPPCFGRRPWSSSLRFKSWRPSERHPTPFDIPRRWNPRTKQQPTGLLFAPPRAVPCCSSPGGPQNVIRHPLTFLGDGTRALNNSPLGCCLPCLRQCRAVQVLTGNKKEHPDGCSFLLWARQDLNPRPSGYEPPALTN